MSAAPEDDFYSDNDHQDDHNDEKWLVSYADMMTLLFGFFVMLYVLSTTNKAKMEETLQKISKEGFNSDVATDSDPKPTITNMQAKNAATDDILIELKKRREEKEKKQLEEELIQTKADSIRNERELQTALEKMKSIQESKITIEKEKFEVELKMKELERISAEQNDLVTKSSKDLEQIKKMKKNVIELEANLKTIEDQNKNILEQNALLKKQLEDGPRIKDDDHFMMVFVRWETEKHDIDMIVEDPKGNVFNYKKRTLANVPGEFVVDTTQGPGVESWVTNKTIEGVYKITYKFYNQYGNKKDAVIKSSVFNNLKVENLPPITLNFSQGKEKTISIKVAKDGQFEVIP